MNILRSCLLAAGCIQVAIVLANFYLPGKLRYRENLARVAPIIRQAFFVHASYIVGIVLLFAAVTFGFASELTSGRGLGRFLAAAMCVFWLVRVPVQVFYYDGSLRRANRLGDAAMLAALAFLAATYGAAALVA
ncbi:MAG: hypothetical protein WAM91_06930 [Candidatus Acidiferrales bacterium]